MSAEIKQIFNPINSAAKTLKELDQNDKENSEEKGDKMMMNLIHHAQLAQLEIGEEILAVNKKEMAKERNRLQW